MIFPAGRLQFDFNGIPYYALYGGGVVALHFYRFWRGDELLSSPRGFDELEHVPLTAATLPA